MLLVPMQHLLITAVYICVCVFTLTDGDNKGAISYIQCDQ